MKKQVEEYLKDKTSCPAKAYRHPDGMYFCYAHTFWDGKTRKAKDVPICDPLANYCEWKGKE